MKTLLFIATCMLTLGLSAQSKYETGMNKALAQYKAAKTVEDMQSASALFERIGDSEKDKWLPYYYAALSNHMTSWLDEKSDKDKIAAKSIALIEKAEALESNNAELFCLRQMVAVSQMTVDPMSRWATYGTQASAALENAKKADPNNPRIYYLQGQTVLNTPEAFGGGKKVAKQYFEKAVELYKTFELASPFHPDWGKDEATKLLADCQ